MIDEELQEKLLSVFDKRFQDYNTKVLEELGNVIKQLCNISGLPNKLSTRASVPNYRRISKKKLGG